MKKNSFETEIRKKRNWNIFILVLTFLFLFFLLHLIFDLDRSRLVFDDSRKNAGIYLDEPGEFLLFSPKPDIVGWFVNWGELPGKSKLEKCSKERYAVPLITWMPFNVEMSDIASGSEDEYIRSFFRSLKEYAPKTDVLIRFAHEMEMRPWYSYPWYEWQGKDADTYIRAWRRLVTIGREIDPDIKWIWSPNRSDEYSAPYYPGDEYVDYVSLSLNLREDGSNTYENYQSFRDFYEKVGKREHLERYGKKILISETGCSNDDIEKRKDHMRSAFDFLIEDPMMTGVLFFNSTINSDRDYDITGNPELVEEFNNELKRLHSLRGE